MRVCKILVSVLLTVVTALPAFSQSEVLKGVVNNLAFYKQNGDLKYLANAKKSIDSLYALTSDSTDLEMNVYRAVVNSSVLYADSTNKLNMPADLINTTAGIIDKVTLQKKAGKFKTDISFSTHCLANAYIRQGFAAIAKSDFLNAEQQFLKARKYAPEFKQINSYLAYTTARQGNLPAAARFYDNLIDAGTLPTEQVQTAAAIYKAVGDTLKAVNLLERAVKASPDDDILLLDQANIYNNKHDYTSLENLLPGLLKTNGNNADIVFVAANCYDRLGKYQKAEPLYLKAIDLNGSAYAPVFNLGVLYLKKSAQQEGSSKETSMAYAENWLQKANEMSPNDKNCLEALRLLYKQSGKTGQLNKIDNKLKQLTN